MAKWKKGRKPKKEYERDDYFGITYDEFHYVCPECGEWVGGYISFGSGENDWGYEQFKFCRECGQKINWDGIK